MYSLFIIYILLLSFGTDVSLSLLGKEIQIADLFFIFIFARILWDIKKGPIRPVGPIGYFIIVLLALLLIACGFSADKAKSFVEFFSISYLIILYLWISRIKIDQSQLRIALNTWLYLTGSLCVLALGGFIAYVFFGKDNVFITFFTETRFIIPFARVKATFPTINMFSSYLHTGVIFLLAFINHNKRRWIYLVLSILIFVCIFFTASRVLLGIFITIFLAMIPIQGRPLFRFLKYISFAFIPLLLVMVLVTITWMIYPIEVDYDKENHTFNMSFNKSPNLYAIFNNLSMDLIQRSPLAGIGPGVFNQKTKEDLDWEEVKDSYETEDIHKLMPFDPHNTYLGWAAEAGLPFVIVLIGLFCAIARLLWRGYKADTNSFSGRLSYVCFCGLIGFMVNAFYIDILTMRHFWIMLGLGTMAASNNQLKI